MSGYVYRGLMKLLFACAVHYYSGTQDGATYNAESILIDISDLLSGQTILKNEQYIMARK